MAQSFSLLISAHPASQQSAKTALQFAEAALRRGVHLHRVFFFNDGVHCANRFAVPAANDIDLTARWQALQAEHQLDLVVCVSSALRRGLIDQQEAQRREMDSHTLAPGFGIGGLGLWLDACMESDRIVHFGAR